MVVSNKQEWQTGRNEGNQRQDKSFYEVRMDGGKLEVDFFLIKGTFGALNGNKGFSSKMVQIE